MKESAGIQIMLEMLLRLPPKQCKRLLEIGSGYGFVLDLWRHQFGTPAWGVEPAAYGVKGQAALKKFSVVCSMEVIEHVEDVTAFIRLAASYLEEDGILLLSTPNAEVLDRESSTNEELWQTLSPRYHTILMSPAALKSKLQEAGFAYVEAHNSPEQQVVYASRNPPLSSLYVGGMSRLLESQVNRGKFAEAVDHEVAYEALLRQQYPFYQLPPLEGAKKVLKSWTKQGFLKSIPTDFSALQYYRGMTALMYKRDVNLAIDHFEAGVLLMERFVEIQPKARFHFEQHLDRSKFQMASLLAHQSGEARTRGLKELKRIRREGTSSHPLWREKASIERLKLLLNYARNAEAVEELKWLESWWDSGGCPNFR